jgi:ribosomal protein L10
VNFELNKVSSRQSGDFVPIHKVITGLQNFIENAIGNAKKETFDTYSSKWTGSDLLALLSENGLTTENLASIKKQYQTV